MFVLSEGHCNWLDHFIWLDLCETIYHVNFTTSFRENIWTTGVTHTFQTLKHLSVLGI